MENALEFALESERAGARTVVRRALARSPLRLLTPQNDGHAAWVYTSSFGGGFVDGDSVELSIRLGAATKAALLSQSSTKVYRSPAGASQRIEGRLEEGATFFSLPDPVVCFKGSNFSQRQCYDLEAGASLLLVETVHSGRYSSGERWVFDSYRSRIEVRRNQKPVFLESLCLDSGAGPLANRLGRFNAYSLILLLGPELEARGRELLEAVSSERLMQGANLVASGSVLPHEGVVLRLASVSTEVLSEAVRRYLSFVPEMLGDNPWARKW